MTYTETVKVTYSQNWHAYNEAQTNENDKFIPMLADLCSLIPNPPQTIGRPRLPLADMAFTTVYRTYVGCSSRRFASDLRAAQEQGLVERAPSLNTILTYLRDPAMTEALTAMLEVSSLPVRAVETQFALDSSGVRDEQPSHLVLDQARPGDHPAGVAQGPRHVRHVHPHRHGRRGVGAERQ